jgi:uncharacterized protein (DUF58 family)
LRVIREVLFFEPKQRGTNLDAALQFMLRVTPHRAIAVLISDFLAPPGSHKASSLAAASLPLLRQVNRRHDLVAVQIADRYELELPALRRVVFEDAESGEVVELRTTDPASRDAFAVAQGRAREELERTLRSAGIDTILLRTDQPYGKALGRFFENRERRRLHG